MCQWQCALDKGLINLIACILFSWTVTVMEVIITATKNHPMQYHSNASVAAEHLQLRGGHCRLLVPFFPCNAWPYRANVKMSKSKGDTVPQCPPHSAAYEMHKIRARSDRFSSGQIFVHCNFF